MVWSFPAHDVYHRCFLRVFVRGTSWSDFTLRTYINCWSTTPYKSMLSSPRSIWSHNQALFLLQHSMQSAKRWHLFVYLIHWDIKSTMRQFIYFLSFTLFSFGAINLGLWEIYWATNSSHDIAVTDLSCKGTNKAWGEGGGGCFGETRTLLVFAVLIFLLWLLLHSKIWVKCTCHLWIISFDRPI